ncbi:hypothetical protein NP233_g5840 [Leucocoprinus birnbaumii]|uniref:Transforming growth factor beta regulator 1 n=1 Tax=Leucocoprinus birnbaumii TaxID=56174 RepID=A0AAD5VY86_9AGAR|nr:hypothetical protein NP233_g5840 [Leucocoprinus birnbaumii]
MTLVTAKDTKLESSLVPEAGSSSSLGSQNSNRYQRPADKIGKTGELAANTAQKSFVSTSAETSGVNESDAPGDDDPSHSTITVSPTGPQSEVAGSIAVNGTTVTNGTDPQNQATHSAGHGQTPLAETPLQQQLQSDGQEAQNFPGTSAHSVPPHGRVEATHALLTSTPNGQTLADGDSVLPASSTASAPSTSNAPSVSPPPSSNVESAQANTPTTDDSMPVDSPDRGARVSTVEEEEPLSRRTRSRGKRLPDTMSKEPAKRVRKARDTATGGGKAAAATNMNANANARAGVHDPSSSTSQASATRQPIPAQPEVPTVATPAVSPPQMANTILDPNLDPALASSSTLPTAPNNNPDQPTNSEGNSSDPVPSSSASEQPKTDSVPPSLANNPYLALSTAFLKGAPGNGGPGFNPYTLYYGPGTPITPHTPTYPYPYIYHLPGPIAAQAMYPASPTFPSPPTTQKPPPTASTSNGDQRQKPKRLKAHTVTSGNHNIPIVPRDKKGKPMLPLNVGIMTVIRLGEVCTREHFHTERYIFPVGYEVTRRYLSTMDPNCEVVYHCTILDGGDGPKFQIVPSDAPDKTVIAGTATGAWSSIVKQANAIRSRQHSNSVSGPDFFGLGQNTIKHLIQELPNADRLRDYVWQNFNEGGPLGGRHAAVTPALPEDYDSTLPIGALFPSERERMKQETSPRGLSYYPQHIIAQAEAQRQQHIDPAQPNAPVLDVSLLQAPVAVPTPANDVLAGPVPQPPIAPGNIPSQSTPSIPSTLDPNSQPSPTSVPTTIAGIMSAYPVPTPSASAPAQASPAPTPSQPSSS